MDKALANYVQRVEMTVVFRSPTPAWQLPGLAIGSYPRQTRCTLPTRRKIPTRRNRSKEQSCKHKTHTHSLRL